MNHLQFSVLWIKCGSSGISDSGPEDARRRAEEGVARPKTAHAEGGLTEGGTDLVLKAWHFVGGFFGVLREMRLCRFCWITVYIGATGVLNKSKTRYGRDLLYRFCRKFDLYSDFVVNTVNGLTQYGFQCGWFSGFHCDRVAIISLCLDRSSFYLFI